MRIPSRIRPPRTACRKLIRSRSVAEPTLSGTYSRRYSQPHHLHTEPARGLVADLESALGPHLIGLPACPVARWAFGDAGRLAKLLGLRRVFSVWCVAPSQQHPPGGAAPHSTVESSLAMRIRRCAAEAGFTLPERSTQERITCKTPEFRRYDQAYRVGSLTDLG
jgi:hypothetical protein